MSVRPSMRWAVPAACSGDMYHGVPETMPFSPPPAWASSRARPKSTSTGAAVGGEDDVRRLDVAVDDEPGVGVGQGVGHGGRDPGRLRPGRAVVPQPPAEVGAVEVIGDDVHLPLLHADVVDRHDAGVAQLGEPSAPPAGTVRLRPAARGRSGVQHLDGHGPVELACRGRGTRRRSRPPPGRAAPGSGRSGGLGPRCRRGGRGAGGGVSAAVRREVRGPLGHRRAGSPHRQPGPATLPPVARRSYLALFQGANQRLTILQTRLKMLGLPPWGLVDTRGQRRGGTIRARVSRDLGR